MSMPGDPMPEEQQVPDDVQNPIEALMPEPPKPRRRVRSVTVDKVKIADRVSNFYVADLQSRAVDREKRLQRYAKFRMWSEGKNWPWVGASDIGLPDMMEKSLRVQDTLHNAVMGSRPSVFNAKAANDTNKGKEDTITKLLDYQVFTECRGETVIGELIDSFVNDGCFTAFIPWVKEKREIADRIEYPFPGNGEDFFQYLSGIVNQNYPQAIDIHPEDEEGWDWLVQISDEEQVRVSFYTEEDETDAADNTVLCIEKKYVVTHDSPAVIAMDYDDVIYPAGVANLQAPGPANPGGAPHVMLRSDPTIDEIKALAAQGYYDLVTEEDLEKLRPEIKSSDKFQKDTALDRLQGQSMWKVPIDTSQGTVTRLVVFDRFDLDGDGLAEDVVFWVLPELKIVLRARLLSEVFPAKVPRRPLAEATFCPVGGRREGISLLEMQEGIHDMQKMLFDIACDSGTLGAMPVFFYRMAGALKPENLQVFPGMGIPVGDPQRDISFPNIANQNGLGMMLNLISMLGTWGDRATMIGEFQLGRVPAGKSSALRTTGSVSMLQAQGDARPERILRRLFIGLSQIWSIIHDLNCAFLPRGKQIRVSGLKRPDEDPYVTIEGRNHIDGIYDFEFEANAFNTSKAAMQQALMQVSSALLSPLGVQTGLVKPDNIYNLFRDLGKSFGLSVDKYITPPNPEASLPPITAQDAVTAIASGVKPYGRPAEGAQAHLETLAEFMQSDDFGHFDDKQVQVFGEYLKMVMQRFEQEQQQAMMMQAAAQFQQAMGQQGGGQGAQPGQQTDPNAQPQVSSGQELMDETLPTAGGGGQQMAAE